MESEKPPEQTPPDKESGRKRTSKRSGKQRPTNLMSHIHAMLMRSKGLATADPRVLLHLAALNEYVIHEVIKLAGRHAINRNSKSIDPEDLMAAVREDPELNQLLGPILERM